MNTINSLYNIVLFDLDGTLIESGPGIFAATRAMMAELNVPDISDEMMQNLVGPPLRLGFTKYLGIGEDRVDEAIRIYKHKAETCGMDEIKPYPGIIDLLSSLRAAGRFIGIVTSKVTPTARLHIERFGLAPYIDYVCGAKNNGVGEKTELLMQAVSELELADSCKRAVMVGDRFYDLNAATNVGMDSIGVLYGYGSPDEIASCKPTYIVRNVSEMKALLLGQ